MTAKVRATIGITCFNAEATIGRAIASAMAQNLMDVEILVVDDASTDGSVDAVLKSIGTDARARLIRHHRNRGPAGSRNTLLEAASGAFILFFDDDDESAPNRARIQIARIEAFEREHRGRPIACFASGRRVYSNGYSCDLPAIGSRLGQEVFADAIADYLLFFERSPNAFFGAGTPTCALAMRLETLKALGGFDEAMRRVEDADLAVRLGRAGGVCIGTPEVLFTQHATKAIDKSPERNLAAEQYLIDKNRDYLETRGVYRHARLWPELRYWHFERNRFRFMRTLTRLFVRNPVRTVSHLIATGPRRLRHEQRMNACRNNHYVS